MLARTFDRVCAVLTELGYIEGDAVTPEGRRLSGLYTELDLVAAECLRRGTWAGLSAPELAACVSALTFESRGWTTQPAAAAGRPGAEVLADMVRLWGELDGVEHDHGLSFLREPDLGFAWTAHAWTRGVDLQRALGDRTPGDFVRAVKQLIDLLDQIARRGRPRPAGQDGPDGHRRAAPRRRGVLLGPVTPLRRSVTGPGPA